MATAAELAHRQAIEGGHWILGRRTFRPPADQVFKAKKHIKTILGNRQCGQLLPKTDFSEELESEELGAAAIQWALFDLVRANLLHVEPPPGMKLEDGYTHGCSIIAIGNPWKWPLYQLKKEFDPDETMPLVVASGQGQLNVERWSELGIGIYQDTTYFGISPCPDNYAVFPLESATELPLRGRRWKVLLNLLAGSENGNSANKKEMMQELQMFDPGNYSPLDESEVAEHSGRLTLARTLNSELTKKIGDLARKLRACVDCPDKEGSTAVLSAADTTCIQSLFMVRPLVRGPDGKLHFGKERAIPKPPLRHNFR
jgi:hypothetical protein